MNTAEALKHSKRSLKIPSLPAVVLELHNLMSDPDVSVADIGSTLIEDPELSMRVLRIANGALFGLPTPVLDPRQAATILGINRLHAVVLQAATTNAFEGGAKRDPMFEEHWKHSILVAHIARDIGKRAKNTELMSPEELHIAGLLHDVGRAILIQNLREEYDMARQLSVTKGIDIIEAEREAFGCHHGQLGAKLVLTWQLPRSLAQTIAFHHSPWKVAKAIPSTVVISVADRLAHAVQNNDLEGMPHIAERKDLFFLGISMGQLLKVATTAIRTWRAIEL